MMNYWNEYKKKKSDFIIQCPINAESPKMKIKI